MIWAVIRRMSSVCGKHNPELVANRKKRRNVLRPWVNAQEVMFVVAIMITLAQMPVHFFVAPPAHQLINTTTNKHLVTQPGITNPMISVLPVNDMATGDETVLQSNKTTEIAAPMVGVCNSGNSLHLNVYISFCTGLSHSSHD